MRIYKLNHENKRINEICNIIYYSTKLLLIFIYMTMTRYLCQKKHLTNSVI